MSELHLIPGSWQWVTLQDIAEVVTGNTPPTSDAENYGGDVPFIKPPQLNDMPVCEAPETLSRRGLDKSKLLPPGSVLVSCIGILGKTAITKNISATNQQINAIIFEPYVRPDYGFHYSQTLAPWLKENSSATTVAIINKRKFEVAPFPLPPANEQTRIVEKLEELLSDLDAGVAELKAAQKKLGQYRQSLLKAAVEGALTAEWRKQRRTPSPQPLPPEGGGAKTVGTAAPSPLSPCGRGVGGEGETGAQLHERILTERRARWEAKQLARFKEQGKTPPRDWQKKYPEPVKPEPSELPELPEGWVWASLDQLTEFITSGSRGWADYYADKGAMFIRSQNINRDWLDLSDIAFVNPPLGTEGLRTRVRQHDLLLTITGANVGKSAVVDVELEEAYVSQHVALVRPIDIHLTNFLHLFLTAAVGGRGQLDKEAYGAGKPGLNLPQVGAVVVPVPGEDEMRELMTAVRVQLDATAEQEQSISRALIQSAAQRKNLLKAAFSGQLVPQDPNDEPASVLLERIRAERAERSAEKKPRGRRAKEVSQ